MGYINVVLPFLVTYTISISQSDNNFDAQYKLMDQFLTIKNLDTAHLYTCWSLSGNKYNLFGYYNL